MTRVLERASGVQTSRRWGTRCCVGDYIGHGDGHSDGHIPGNGCGERRRRVSCEMGATANSSGRSDCGDLVVV